MHWSGPHRGDEGLLWSSNAPSLEQTSSIRRFHLEPSSCKAEANVQVPAAYRFKLGGFECTVVSDGPLKLGTFSAELFKGISQERIDEILAANFLDKTNFTVDQNALVVNTGGKLVLIDTGMGFRKVYGPKVGKVG